jgi:hypothetical protein
MNIMELNLKKNGDASTLCKSTKCIGDLPKQPPKKQSTKRNWAFKWDTFVKPFMLIATGNHFRGFHCPIEHQNIS